MSRKLPCHVPDLKLHKALLLLPIQMIPPHRPSFGVNDPSQTWQHYKLPMSVEFRQSVRLSDRFLPGHVFSFLTLCIFSAALTLADISSSSAAWADVPVSSETPVPSDALSIVSPSNSHFAPGSK